MRLDKKGFTLIEVIIALVLAGLLAALAGPMLSGAMKGSATTLLNLESAVTLQSLMEKIIESPKTGALSAAKSYAQSIMPSGYEVVLDKTGYCTLSGSSFTLNTGATSGSYYQVTIQKTGTGETLSMMFSDQNK